MLKRKKQRGRPYKNGRCDLWVADVDSPCAWAFEFKQYFLGPRFQNDALKKQLDAAYSDAEQLSWEEADHRFGGIILAPQKTEINGEWGHNLDEDAVERVDQMCRNDADVAFRVSGPSGPIWLAFKEVK